MYYVIVSNYLFYVIAYFVTWVNSCSSIC